MESKAGERQPAVSFSSPDSGHSTAQQRQCRVPAGERRPEPERLSTKEWLEANVERE